MCSYNVEKQDELPPYQPPCAIACEVISSSSPPHVKEIGCCFAAVVVFLFCLYMCCHIYAIVCCSTLLAHAAVVCCCGAGPHCWCFCCVLLWCWSILYPVCRYP